MLLPEGDLDAVEEYSVQHRRHWLFRLHRALSLRWPKRALEQHTSDYEREEEFVREWDNFWLPPEQFWQ